MGDIINVGFPITPEARAKNLVRLASGKIMSQRSLATDIELCIQAGIEQDRQQRTDAGRKLAEACRAIVIRCEKGFLETKWKGQPTIRDLAAAALAEWDRLEGGK